MRQMISLRGAVAMIFIFACLLVNPGYPDTLQTEPADWGLVRQVLPQYPKGSNLTGEVIVSIDLDEQGKVKKATISKGPETLRVICLEAVQQWQFYPFIKGGNPTKTSGTVTCTFSSDGTVKTSYNLSLSTEKPLDLVPEAMIPVTDAEAKWWAEIRQASHDLKSLSRELGEAINKFNKKTSRNDEDERERLRNEFFNSFKPRISAAETVFKTLLREGQKQSWRVPLANTGPRILLIVDKATYTKAARQNKISGVVTLQLQIGLDGSAEVVKVERGLPDGLTQKSIETAHNFIFLPSIRNGSFVTRNTKVEFTFNVY